MLTTQTPMFFFCFTSARVIWRVRYSLAILWRIIQFSNSSNCLNLNFFFLLIRFIQTQCLYHKWYLITIEFIKKCRLFTNATANFAPLLNDVPLRWLGNGALFQSLFSGSDWNQNKSSRISMKFCVKISSWYHAWFSKVKERLPKIIGNIAQCAQGGSDLQDF